MAAAELSSQLLPFVSCGTFQENIDTFTGVYVRNISLTFLARVVQLKR